MAGTKRKGTRAAGPFAATEADRAGARASRSAPDPAATTPTATAAETAKADSARAREPERCLVPAGCDWPVVLGIDPGTRAMGYGAIVLAPDGPRLLVAGVIAPRAGAVLAERLAEIAAELPRVLARCRPHWLAIERAFSAVNVQ